MELQRPEKGPEDFYASVIKLLNRKNFVFMVGGGYSVREHSTIDRPMKDLDLFCKAGDVPKILRILKEAGFKTLIQDERWIAKAIKGKNNIDFIFSSPNYISPVDNSWFDFAQTGKLYGMEVKLVPPEELIWTKSFIQDRNWFEGADVNHIILSQGKTLDWKRLLRRMENYWEILLQVLINFRFVYPSERGIVPQWLMLELVSRLKNQLNNPIPKDKVCRGPLLSRTQYSVDIQKEGFEFYR